MNKTNFIRAKWFALGVLITFMISGTALMASPVMRELIFGVSVTLDGETIQFEEDMRPFVIDGRTFLPVRAIADLVGLGVGFDEATNTVILTTTKGGYTAANSASFSTVREYFEVNVEEFQELVDAMDAQAAMRSAVFGIEMTIVLEIVGDHTLRYDVIYGPDVELDPTIEADLAVEIAAMADFGADMAQMVRAAMGVETLYINFRTLDSTGRVLAEVTFAGH